MWIESVVPLPPEDSGLQHCIIRLNNSCVDAKRADPARFFRREPVVIRNPDTGDWVIRYVMGTAGGLSICRAQCGLDYDAIDTLNVRFKRPTRLEVRRARYHEICHWFWSHPDISVRLSSRLGFFGAAMGILGLAVGVIGLITAIIPLLA